MDADSVAEAVFGLHPTGPMVIHVVDQDYEYWLEVTEVKPASLVDPPWTGGVIIETKPIPAGVMARRPVFTPRPFFHNHSSYSPLPTPAERLQELQTEGALDFIPQDPKDPRGGREMVYITPPESSGVVEIPVDPHYGRPPTIDDIATKSPEQLAQMYPNGLPSFTPNDPSDSLTSETENIQSPAPELRFQQYQYRSPFQEPARPVPGKSYARMELAQHGRLPETGWRYGADETAPEFQGAGTEHLAEELGAQQNNGDNVDRQDPAEPHYSVAREINEKEQS